MRVTRSDQWSLTISSVVSRSLVLCQRSRLASGTHATQIKSRSWSETPRTKFLTAEQTHWKQTNKQTNKQRSSSVLSSSFPGPFPYPAPPATVGKRPWEREWCFVLIKLGIEKSPGLITARDSPRIFQADKTHLAGIWSKYTSSGISFRTMNMAFSLPVKWKMFNAQKNHTQTYAHARTHARCPYVPHIGKQALTANTWRVWERYRGVSLNSRESRGGALNVGQEAKRNKMNETRQNRHTREGKRAPTPIHPPHPPPLLLFPFPCLFAGDSLTYCQTAFKVFPKNKRTFIFTATPEKQHLTSLVKIHGWC